MTGPVVLSNAQDAYVESKNPKKNYNSSGQMYLQDGTFGYLFFSRPFPLGARIISAKLRVFTGATYTGTLNMLAARVTGDWKSSRINWDNKPAASGSGTVTVSKSNPAARTMWEFDLKAMMQLVSDGAAWYGVRLDLNGTARKWIHSAQSSTSSLRPVLEIEWADEPEAPSVLSPDGGSVVGSVKPTLRFDFTDVSGDTRLAAYQVQLSSVADFSTVDYDTGRVPATVPSCDLTQTFNGATYTGLPTSGSLRYWRVRVEDGAGLWSEYSAPASMKYLTLGTANITSPSSSSPFVEDSTPPILWTFSLTQERYRLRLLDGTTNAQLWSSGEVTTAETAVTIPARLITTLNKVYRLELRVWDTENREDTPNSATYVEVIRDFTYRGGSTAAVSSITAYRDAGWPWWIVEVVSSSAPDSFKLFRDGVLIRDDLEPQDYLVAGTTDTYRFIDRKVPGRQDHTWTVARVTNSVQSGNNPSVTKTVRNDTPWLMELDGSNAIPLLNPSVAPGVTEDSTVMYPQGAAPVLITQSQWGYVGEASGELTNSYAPSGLTAKQMLDRFKAMRAKRGQRLVFLWADQAIECFIYEADWGFISNPSGSTDYTISFGFVEQDYA